ncbi:hypothetical protein [Algibacter sp. 2305UL17-15]|uniref:hypothetical protein n=1 Tax=Algibacter sp. 2305UL17-15 TaxID=3231268 RepID=UPI00345A8AD6
MKNLMHLLFTTLLILGGCKNDDDNTPIAPIDQLPPATKFGANTAGCLVNGEVHLPNKRLTLNYLGRKDFALSISKEIDDVFYKVYIYIYIGNTELEVGKTYQLKQEIDGSSSFGWYYSQNPLPNLFEMHYQTTVTVIGEVTITHHDADNFILSGTFWFDAKFDHLYKLNDSVVVNVTIDESEIIEVTEGRFDMIYNI